jgi:UDP-3-O-[3-hydroxymyristoyl] glucosamine N-acyltransferase
MPDGRFFTTRAPLTIAEALMLAGVATLSAEGRVMRAASADDDALEGAVVFAEDEKIAGVLKGRAFALCFATPAAAAALAGAKGVVVESATPRAAFGAIARALHAERRLDDVELGHAKIEASARVHSTAIIGPGAEIGADAVIGAHAVIGPGVVIGPRSRLADRVTIYCALLGADCFIGAGTVIGGLGFGFAPGPRGIERAPQLGRVLIGDRVETGGNVTIDRGALTDTTIGDGVKIDNLVHIAHNVRIGRDCLIAGQVGFAGSTVVGERVLFGGQAGIADHLTIGDDARIGAKAGLMRDVPEGETWGGYPAQPIRAWLKEAAMLARLARGPKKSKD